MQAGLARYEMAGPGLLSAEPAEDNTPEPQPQWWPTLYQHAQSGLESDRNWRWSWWVHWGHLARLFLPYRYHWVITPNRMNKGNPLNDAIVNETGTLAVRVCAAGCSTGLMSPSRPWFRFGPAFDSVTIDAAGRRWLDDVATIVYAVLSGSNFYKVAAQMWQDLVVFGTSPMIIYEDREDIIRAYVPCAGEYFLRVGARLSTDTLRREYVYTVEQLVDWFGLRACPEEIRNHWTTGGSSLAIEYVVCHVIEPNYAVMDRSTHRSVSPIPGSFTYREVYWLRNYATSAPLSIRGFIERPFMAMRWSKTSNDPYGRSPCMDALGGNAQLQHQEVRYGEYIDKIVRPPMVAPVSLKNQPSSIRSGDVTYIDGNTGKPQYHPAFEVNPNGIAPMQQGMERVEKRIDRALFVDTFLAISQMEGVQPREMLELQLRQGEKIQQLGPVIENAERELSVGVQRVVAILHRRGAFPPMPASLRGTPIKIEYVSLMKLMQQAAETAGMSATVKFAGEMTEAAMSAGLKPPMRVLDLDGYVRRFADRVGNPAKLVFSEQEVEAHDEAKAQAAQAQQALAATVPAVQAAEGLSKIDVGGGQSAVQAMLGTGPGGSGVAGRA